jgi:uncharacterized membrane protein YbhN (UPF0104 family)
VVLIAAAIAAFVLLGLSFLAGLDLDAVSDALAGADARLVALSAVLYAAGQTTSGVMWGACQRAGGIEGLSWARTLGMHWVARGACEMLPASLGEAVRVAVVRRHPGGQRAGSLRIVGALAGYKALDAAVTGAVVFLTTLVMPLPGPVSGLRWTAAGALVVVVALLACRRLGLARPLRRLVPAVARTGSRRLGDGAAVLRRPRAAAQAATLGVVAVTARVASLAALLAALGVTPAAALLTFAVIALAGVLPGAPGGAGAREALLVPALALAHGVPQATALAASIAVQGVALGTSILVGLAALAAIGPASLRRPVETTEPMLVPAA